MSRRIQLGGGGGEETCHLLGDERKARRRGRGAEEKEVRD